MRIAVIGAGIAGLVVAFGLQRDGHEVTVYERRTDPNADGAGLTLFGNAFAALETIGLAETIRDIADNPLTSLQAGQRTPTGTWLTVMPSQAVNQLHSVHRVTLHDTLMQHLAPDTVQTGIDAAVSTDGAPRLELGATTARFDLVVVADGLRSDNRQRLGLDTGIRYSGYTAWRGVTNRAVDIGSAAAETWGQGKIFGFVPLPDNRLYWFGTCNTAADTMFDDEYLAVTEAFAGWHDPIPACIAATDPDDVIRHDVYDLNKPLDTFTKGRTVLMGDAAHAMLPNLGQGAGQGIEDAATLVVLLRRAGEQGLDAVLARYTALRRGRTTTLWRQSRLLARVAQASGPTVVRLRNTGMRVLPDQLIAPLTQRLHRWEPPKA